MRESKRDKKSASETVIEKETVYVRAFTCVRVCVCVCVCEEVRERQEKK